MARVLVTLLGCAACGLPSPLESADLWAGIKELEAGNASEALDRFDRVNVSPHPALLLNRGLALHQLGQDAPALSALDEAIELVTEPSLRARVLSDRGTVRARAGRTTDAIADYRAALHLAPGDELARHNLELLLRVLSDEPEPDAGAESDDDDEGFAIDQRGPEPPIDLASVSIAPDPSTGLLDAYWRWTTYDTFDGRRWSARARWTTEPTAVPLPKGPVTVQTITFLRRSDANLFGLDHALSFAAGSPITRRGWDARAGEAVRSFTVTSSEAARDVENDPRRFGQLPLRFDPRIRALAVSVSGAEQDPERAAAELTAWLRSHLTYSQARQERAVDPLAAFLFSTKRGDCRLFSSALTMMLRSRGFQARVVGGYRGGRRVGTARYLLASSDLHAWVEVRGVGGWARFDPTPTRDDEPLTQTAAASLIDAVRSRPPTRFSPLADAGVRPRTTNDW
ncbi:MAG: hypothetical protein GQE15_25785 [Archangiaceae bacterium]|nr:hypothetical protein [Archangiaceae bacterium]